MRLILSFAALWALAGCTIIRAHVGVAPLPEALALEPGSSRLSDALDLLGPPDLFCEESGQEDLVYPTALTELASFEPEVFGPWPAGPCFVWLGEEGRNAHLDFGRLLQLGSFAIGFRAYAPAIFGQRREQLRFVRIAFDENGLVRQVHGNFPPGLEAIEVSPFD